MPRKPVPVTADLPYHLTARSNNREWFYLPITEMWNIFSNTLSETSARYGMRVIAFVLMTNHYHLIAQFPWANLGEALNYLQREVSRAVGRSSGRINHVFGGRYKPCLLGSPAYLRHAYKYLYRNPVEAGLCDRVESYPFSTLPMVLGSQIAPFPLHDEIAVRWSSIPSDLVERLAWLNTSNTDAQVEVIRRALRRREFQFSTDHNLRSAVKALS